MQPADIISRRANRTCACCDEIGCVSIEIARKPVKMARYVCRQCGHATLWIAAHDPAYICDLMRAWDRAQEVMRAIKEI